MQKVLVTGVNGFVGKHLTRELKNQGDEVVGIGHETSPPPEVKELLADYWVCDLMDKEAVAKLPLKDIDGVISLAGLARVGDSFSDPEKYKAINVGVLTNLLQALIDNNLKPRVIAVSTGTVYDPAESSPLVEDSKLVKDGSPYTLSKILMEEAAHDFRAKGLDIIVMRPFNHVGPGQEEGFLVPDLYAKLMAAKATGRLIKTGNLSTKRDYTDVRDVSRVYADLVLAPSLSSTVYNICSNVTRSGNEILAALKKHVPGSEELELITDPRLIRANDPEELVGSNELLKKDTGWQPQISFEQTIADFVESRQT